MPGSSTIELRNMKLEVQIGTYGPADVVPDQHILDLTLVIDPSLVLIEDDTMERVFDYDPLVAEIVRLARDRHYSTQERLITRIADACARFAQIESLEIALTKSPVHNGSGSLGVRVALDARQLAARRDAARRPLDQ